MTRPPIIIFNLIVLAGVLSWWIEPDPLGRVLWLGRWTGYGALALLALCLAATPLRLLLQRVELSTTARLADFNEVRRLSGILAAQMALLHAILMFTLYLDSNFDAVEDSAYLRMGLIALILFALLWMTSWPILLKHFKFPLWKTLHEVVYILPLISLGHVLLAPYSSVSYTAVLFAAFALLIAIRPILWLLPKKTKSASHDEKT